MRIERCEKLEAASSSSLSCSLFGCWCVCTSFSRIICQDCTAHVLLLFLLLLCSISSIVGGWHQAVSLHVRGMKMNFKGKALVLGVRVLYCA